MSEVKPRGLERNLKIVDKKYYTDFPDLLNIDQSLPDIPNIIETTVQPETSDTNINKNQITKIIRYGTGWIDVEMADGYQFRRSGGSIAWRYNNPGNIKYGSFARAHQSIGPGWHRHAVFPTFEVGKWAKYNLLFTNKRKYHRLSILKAMSYYAPSNDPQASNSPRTYANYVARHVGVSINTRLQNLTEDQRNKMMDAMQIFEGWKEGNIRKI